MTRVKRIMFASLMVCLASLFITTSALAIPTLPSSFYGTVRVNGNNVADGTLIQALINGQAFAEGRTQTYQGGSVYVLDVPGDKTETTIQDGGREGDTVQFKIGGLPAGQTGMWHSGTNVELNLSASSANTLVAPKASPSPVPTQTAIAIVASSPGPTASVQASQGPTASVQASPTPSSFVQSSSVQQTPAHSSAAGPQPTQPPSAPGSATHPQQNASGNAGLAIFIVLLAIIGAAAAFWATRRNK
jgi:hypothetical protein